MASAQSNGDSQGTLDRARRRITQALDEGPIRNPGAPLGADRWILASALQKAIRRSDPATANTAAAGLLIMDKRTLWRRLEVTALEDVGVGDLGVVAEVVAAVDGGHSWRTSVGGDAAVAGYLVGRMCRAPKDRSADLLLAAAEHSLALARQRLRLAKAPLDGLLDIALHSTSPISLRCLAAWYAAGTDRIRSPVLANRTGAPESLVEAFGRLNLPTGIVSLCRSAFRRHRHPLPIFLPLVCDVVSRSVTKCVASKTLPPSNMIRGIPTYALDKHTRLGKAALRTLLESSRPLHAFLRAHLPGGDWRAATEMADFYVTSDAVLRAFQWDQSDTLTREGTEADLSSTGLEPSSAQGLIEVLREEASRLEDIRVGLLEGIRHSQPSLFDPPLVGDSEKEAR